MCSLLKSIVQNSHISDVCKMDPAHGSILSAGVGAKSAQRLAFHIINMPKEQVEELAGAMTGARNNVRYCKECFTLTDKELCPICSSDKRNHKTIMVVENTRDLAAYEKTAEGILANRLSALPR